MRPWAMMQACSRVMLAPGGIWGMEQLQTLVTYGSVSLSMVSTSHATSCVPLKHLSYTCPARRPISPPPGIPPHSCRISKSRQHTRVGAGGAGGTLL
eukprot:1538094-Rhodomonas_salina.1